ncbi:hypothetical protein [Brachyspira aalborgi]|nr:hypothetical protein [Brachyspira aalborgi]
MPNFESITLSLTIILLSGGCPIPKSFLKASSLMDVNSIYYKYSYNHH